MPKKKEKSVNYEAMAHLKSLIADHIKILNVEVRGKWLCADLDSNTRFMVRNDYQNKQ